MSWPESPRTAPQRQPPGAAGIRRPGGRYPLHHCLAAMLQQEKQRSGPSAMTPKQWSAYIARQMTQFQAVPEQVISKCSPTKVNPPSSQHIKPPKTEILQDNMNPGMRPPMRHMGVFTSTLKSQQRTLSTCLPFLVSSGSGQDPTSCLGSVCPKAKATPLEVPLPKLCLRPLGSQPLTPHQPNLPSVPTMSPVFSNAVWIVAAAAGATPVSKESPLSQVDNSMLQHFDSNSTFAKAPKRAPPAALAFPSHQAVVQANKMAPGAKPGQKVQALLASPTFSVVGNQNRVQSPSQGLVPVLSTRSLQQSTASCSPMSPIQGLEPLSYVATSATARHSAGPLTRMDASPELPQDSVLSQTPTDGPISPSSAGSEVYFIEELLKGSSVAPGEGWVCNLRLIHDSLEQHAAAHSATVQNADQVTKSAEDL